MNELDYDYVKDGMVCCVYCSTPVVAVDDFAGAICDCCEKNATVVICEGCGTELGLEDGDEDSDR